MSIQTGLLVAQGFRENANMEGHKTVWGKNSLEQGLALLLHNLTRGWPEKTL